jgi:hypothetical protein
VEEKYIVVTIHPKGKKMDVEAENFHGVGCKALLEVFDVMGTVTAGGTKPEYDEVNPNFNRLSQNC